MYTFLPLHVLDLEKTSIRSGDVIYQYSYIFKHKKKLCDNFC